MTNAISWFEIPTADLQRATKFYETILGVSMIPIEIPGQKLTMFPVDDMTGVGGALVESGDFYKPSLTDGTLIYLNGGSDLQLVLDKVDAAGGKIVVPKTEISPEYGFMGVFVDTEGNRIGIHSMS
jgi:predicted enzyme related to lactoylglutathione lyase